MRIRSLGVFAQDQWTIRRLTLNLGLRYDYFPGFGYKTLDPDDPAEINNLADPIDLRRMDFGAPRPLDKPIDDDKINFAPRVRTPVLMANGLHDFTFPVETSQKPMLRLLGTPEADKRYVSYPGGHVFPFARADAPKYSYETRGRERVGFLLEESPHEYWIIRCHEGNQNSQM